MAARMQFVALRNLQAGAISVSETQEPSSYRITVEKFDKPKLTSTLHFSDVHQVRCVRRNPSCEIWWLSSKY